MSVLQLLYMSSKIPHIFISVDRGWVIISCKVNYNCYHHFEEKNIFYVAVVAGW